MEVKPYDACDPLQLIALFAQTFTQAQGLDEGAQIEAFVTDLLNTTPPQDLWGFVAFDNAKMIGAVLFSRMDYAQDPRQVVILSPAAVRSAYQGKGVGQALIRHALHQLAELGIDLALTYGDPAFYGKVGFAAVSEAQAAAPMPLSFPHGWLVTSLQADVPFSPIIGTGDCVPALRDPSLW